MTDLHTGAFSGDGFRQARLSHNRYSRGRHDRSNNECRAVPFDAGRTVATDPAVRLGLSTRANVADAAVFCVFRNRDNRPARSTVTAALMGDPPPGRPRPGDPDFPCQDEPSNRTVAALAPRYPRL